MSAFPKFGDEIPELPYSARSHTGREHMLWGLEDVPDVARAIELLRI